jgi:hypothetical protein
MKNIIKKWILRICSENREIFSQEGVLSMEFNKKILRNRKEIKGILNYAMNAHTMS